MLQNGMLFANEREFSAVSFRVRYNKAVCLKKVNAKFYRISLNLEREIFLCLISVMPLILMKFLPTF